MKEIRNRAMTWVYEIVSYETGEIVTVISRKFIVEFSESLHGFYYFNCVGGFNFDGVFREF